MPRTRTEEELAAAMFEDFDPTTAVVRDATELRAISAAAHDLSEAEHTLEESVLAARKAGQTWTAIAAVLGVSKQAARQRFGPLEDKPKVYATARVVRTAAKTARSPIHVLPRPDGRWAVVTARSSRAAKLHPTQAAAIADARRRAQGRDAEVVVKDERGRIQERDRRGRKPRDVRE